MGLDAVAWVNFPSGGHASETAEPQQDAGPTGCHWVSRAGAVWAPSDGAGRTHPKRQNNKGGWAGLDAVALGAVASESKGGWAGLDAVAFGAVASVAALHLRRLLPAGHHAG